MILVSRERMVPNTICTDLLKILYCASNHKIKINWKYQFSSIKKQYNSQLSSSVGKLVLLCIIISDNPLRKYFGHTHCKKPKKLYIWI